MSLYTLARPLLQAMDPERAHGMALWAARRRLTPRHNGAQSPALATKVFGLDFANPLGLAAGFDKDAMAVDGLLRLGFGFVEVGSVTPRPQSGNPKPRLFRLPQDKAVINRMGFNNDGMTAMAARLEARRGKGGLLGINLGKNKDTADAAADYETLIATLGSYASYLVINVSSPNTPGLRALQEKAALQALLARCRNAVGKLTVPVPLLLKIAPDLTKEDEADIAAVAQEPGLLDGLIVSNTTIARPGSLKGSARKERGGLSGRPLFKPSKALLGRMYDLTGGAVPLIGVGGVSSGERAYAKIRAGASLVQLYAALAYEGPALIPAILRDLATCLARDGFASVAEAVGADHKKGSSS